MSSLTVTTSVTPISPEILRKTRIRDRLRKQMTSILLTLDELANQAEEIREGLDVVDHPFVSYLFAPFITAGLVIFAVRLVRLATYAKYVAWTLPPPNRAARPNDASINILKRFANAIQTLTTGLVQQRKRRAGRASYQALVRNTLPMISSGAELLCTSLSRILVPDVDRIEHLSHNIQASITYSMTAYSISA